MKLTAAHWLKYSTADGFSDREKTAMLLRSQSKTQEEIAAELNCCVSTVCSLLSKLTVIVKSRELRGEWERTSE